MCYEYSIKSYDYWSFLKVGKWLKWKNKFCSKEQQTDLSSGFALRVLQICSLLVELEV